MEKGVFGWTGRILKVDLSDSRVTDLETMDYAPRFLGGRGIATRIYWQEVPPEASAFAPENCLIVMSGPLAATGAQGASRFEVVGKSPMLLREGFCYGNLGGFFAPIMKKAGYDGVVVTGRAEKPSYVLVEDGKAQIRDASSLWGKGVYQTRDMLRSMHGEKTRFLATGPAGENKCRNATVITDNEGSATGGFGAVMGSKNLKAIAVNGAGKVPVARPAELTQLNRRTMRLSHRGTLRIPVPKKQIQLLGKAPCYQCGLDCIRGRFRTASGKEAVRKCQSLVFYMPWVGMKPDQTMDTAVDATAICNDLSFCSMEMENIMTWLEACYRHGLLTDRDTGLQMSQIGTREFLEKLATMIARREGFGDILAEGLLRAGKKLGKEYEALFTERVNAVGTGNSYAPREYITNALLYALEPRQPIAMLHEVSYMIARWLLHRIRPELSPTSSQVFREATTKFWKHEKAWDLTTYEGKALVTTVIQDRNYVKDSLVLCDAAWPIIDSFNTPDHTGDPALESKIFSAVTGIETDEAGLLRYGERIFNQQRAIVLREGWRAKEDDVPARWNFTEPVVSDRLNPQLIVPGPTEEPVSVRGQVLDRARFEQMREEFYTLRGWDPRNGLQKAETLAGLGLSDVAETLGKEGKLA